MAEQAIENQLFVILLLLFVYFLSYIYLLFTIEEILTKSSRPILTIFTTFEMT